MTHTYTIVEVTSSTYEEIRAVLIAAGYQHAIHKDEAGGDGEVLDMHGGIALRVKRDDAPKGTYCNQCGTPYDDCERARVPRGLHCCGECGRYSSHNDIEC